jgi:hypothetical protein
VLADVARFSKNWAVSMALIFSAIATTKNWFMVVSSLAAIRLAACLSDRRSWSVDGFARAWKARTRIDG